MARRSGLSEERKREIALAACRRMVARGERPIFRLLVEETPLGIWVSHEQLGAGAWAKRRTDAAAVGRQAIAELLEVDPAAIDVTIATA